MPTTTETVQIVDLTHDLASTLAERIPDYQRNQRPAHIERLARDMSNGNWSLAPGAIAVISDGNGGFEALEDGQHRVLARLKATPPGPVPVILLVRPSSNLTNYLITDTGLKRTMADFMKAKGVGDYNLAAAMATRCAMIDRQGGVLSNNQTPSHVEIAKWYDACNLELFDEARLAGRRVYQSAGGNLTTMGSLIYLVARDFDKDLVMAFADDVKTGIGVADKTGKDAAILLRDQFSSWQGSKLNPPAVLMWNITVKAWHLYVAGERRKFLRWSRTSDPLPVVPKWMMEMVE